MNKVKARRLVRAAYNHQPNFITPQPVDYGMAGELAWELSTGPDLLGAPIWGVSVVQHGQPRRDLCNSFPTRADATAHIATLNA